MSPTILHADMNACYASIEQARNPALRGKAMAVCGSVEARNGIILAKSQEAKIQGVKTGEAIWEAQQKCPGLLLVPADFSLYLAYSKMAHHIYLDYTNRVEAFGMDECWLDVTGTDRLFGDGETLARTLRASRLLPQPKAVQRAFFPDYPAHEKKEDLSRALFAIRSRFGSKSVDFAALYGYDYADLDRDRADMPTNKFVACAR